MLQTEKNITLNLRSRPLRLAYLVTCLEDLKDAISLYTHTWGGAANALLAVADDEEKIKQLKNSLIKFDPDYIFSTEGMNLPVKVKELLQGYSVKHYCIRQESIDKFINSKESIYLHVGNANSEYRVKLPHIVSILKSLYSSQVSDSEIYVLDSLSSKFNLELSLQAGTVSESYQKSLIEHLGAKILPTPQNVESFFQTSLCLSTSINPTSITLLNTTKQHRTELFDFNSGWLDQSSALCLFLYEKGNLDIATSFWNVRWFHPLNKLLISKQLFIDNLEHYTKLTLLAIPSLKAVHVALATGDRNKAENLQKNIKDRVSAVAKREIQVWLSYKNFYEEVRKVSVYTSSPKISSQRLHSDDSIRFLPETPSGLETGDFAFGYDAELHSEANNRLLFPKSSAICTLLSNSLSKIEYYEKNKLDIQSFSLRGTDAGVAGIATTGREYKLYIHPDTAIISRYLKNSVGVDIKANRHTRYAEGFIKRLGGLGKIYSLACEGGIETLLALCSKGSNQGGLEISNLANFLRDKVQIEHKKAQNIINTQLPELLASGLVKRGVSLKCPICDLETWYSVSSLDEFIKCQGCFEKFQFENLRESKFSYIPNELSRRLIENGGIAVLATASLFLRANAPGFIQFGGDLFETNQRNNFAEIDLIVIAGEICAIAECKYFSKLDNEEQITKALSSIDGLEKAIKVAERIGAKIVLLGVSTNLEASDQQMVKRLQKGVADLQKDAQTKGIGVYLLLTGSGVNQDLFTSINLETLLPTNSEYDESKHIYQRGVGELPNYREGKVDSFDEVILKIWKSQLLS